jgi:hypothetical protein
VTSDRLELAREICLKSWRPPATNLEEPTLMARSCLASADGWRTTGQSLDGGEGLTLEIVRLRLSVLLIELDFFSPVRYGVPEPHAASFQEPFGAVLAQQELTQSFSRGTGFNYLVASPSLSLVEAQVGHLQQLASIRAVLREPRDASRK